MNPTSATSRRILKTLAALLGGHGIQTLTQFLLPPLFIAAYGQFNAICRAVGQAHRGAMWSNTNRHGRASVVTTLANALLAGLVCLGGLGAVLAHSYDLHRLLPQMIVTGRRASA